MNIIKRRYRLLEYCYFKLPTDRHMSRSLQVLLGADVILQGTAINHKRQKLNATMTAGLRLWDVDGPPWVG